MKDFTSKTDSLFISIRGIMRAIDLNSKQLVVKYGLTGPQMLLLKYIYQAGDNGIISSSLAKKVSLSMATITSIIDRLLKKDLVDRVRAQDDKRKVYLVATPSCRAIMEKEPDLFQEAFIAKFEQLEDWEQSLMLSSFERVANMMGASTLDLAPILEINADLGSTSF